MSTTSHVEHEGITTANVPGRDSQRSSGRFGPVGPRRRRQAGFVAALGFLLVCVSAGCAGGEGRGAGPELRGRASQARGEVASSAVFPTIEAAALEALARARSEAEFADRGRLRIGTIRRVATGFSYSPPLRSRGTIHSTASMKVRFRLGPYDVATYVVHPRSGQARIDRLNEVPTEHEKRLVDEMDPRHRPIYVLTPSEKVFRYRHGRNPFSIVQRDGSERRLRSAMHAQ